MTTPECHTVYANNQGSKNGLCPYYHTYINQSGSLTHQKGKIIQLSCSVKFHFFTPTFIHGIPSTKYMAIISYGVHQHPPPPAHRIPPQIQERLLTAVKAFGVGEATARKLIASPILPVMLNGKTTLSQEHITLTNHDVINYLIRKERAKEFPWGTDFQGVQYLMNQQNLSNPYIRHAELFDNGRFIILCQSPEQSRLLIHFIVLNIDY